MLPKTSVLRNSDRTAKQQSLHPNFRQYLTTTHQAKREDADRHVMNSIQKPFSVLPLAPQITKPEDFWFLRKTLSVYTHKQAHLCDYRKETGTEEKKGSEGNCALSSGRGKTDLTYAQQTGKYDLS